MRKLIISTLVAVPVILTGTSAQAQNWNSSTIEKKFEKRSVINSHASYKTSYFNLNDKSSGKAEIKIRCSKKSSDKEGRGILKLNFDIHDSSRTIDDIHHEATKIVIEGNGKKLSGPALNSVKHFSPGTSLTDRRAVLDTVKFINQQQSGVVYIADLYRFSFDGVGLQSALKPILENCGKTGDNYFWERGHSAQKNNMKVSDLMPFQPATNQNQEWSVKDHAVDSYYKAKRTVNEAVGSVKSNIGEQINEMVIEGYAERRRQAEN